MYSAQLQHNIQPTVEHLSSDESNEPSQNSTTGCTTSIFRHAPKKTHTQKTPGYSAHNSSIDCIHSQLTPYISAPQFNHRLNRTVIFRIFSY